MLLGIRDFFCTFAENILTTMKKNLIPLSLLFLPLCAEAQDFNVYSNNIGGEEMLELFYTALQDGRRYPTDAEFEAAGYDLMDIAFVRSHVRPRSAMVDHSKDVNPIVGEGRRLWMNIPIGVGKHTGGYPNSRFTDDTFSGWNYTHIFGSWNHDLFHVPAATVDAGHRHGTDVYSGIKFFESWTAGSQASGWVNVISAQDPKGYDGYKYVEPLINCLMYFGQDGINYNWEDAGYSQQTVIKFHQACYKLAKERGFDNFHIGLYTSISALTSQGSTEALLGKDGVKTADAFLNYSGGSFASYGTIAKSVETAEKYFGSAQDCYQGALLSGLGADKNWQALNKTDACKRMQVVLWGEHDQSRIFSWCKGEDAQDFAEMYQKRQEYFFSGGNRNPALRPTPGQQCKWRDIVNLLPFEGVAEYIPERATLQQSLPFATNFCLGSGERYYYNGKRTHGSWYNMGQQDIVPTYRWLAYEAGTTNAMTVGLPEYTYGDAYIGGTSVRLTATVPQDVVLYRCALTVGAANPKVELALKRPANVSLPNGEGQGGADGTLSLIIKKKDAGEWIETPLPVLEGNTWTTVEAALQDVAEGDIIEYVGLRTSGNVNGLLVGRLALTDDAPAVTPASVRDLAVEVKEETTQSLSVKLRWDVDASSLSTSSLTRPTNDLLYNDEAAIDHFEVFLKDGADGRVREVGRTSTWSAYVGNIDTDEDTYVGVRAASVDGKTYSPIVWTAVAHDAAAAASRWERDLDGWPAIRLDLQGESVNDALKGGYVTAFSVTGADEDYSYINTAGNPYMVDIAAGTDADHADKTNYVLAPEPIRVTQGQTLRCTLQLPSALQQSCARGYADWDGNRQFDATSPKNGGVVLTDEQVWTSGLSNNKKMNTELGATANFQIKVPTDAHPGESRLRLVFNNNYYAHPGPSGLHVGGFAIDFPLEISGTNAPRAVTPDYRDQGVADEPVGLTNQDVVGISAAPAEAVSRVDAADGALHFTNVDKAWIYAADGRLVAFLANVPATHPLLPGTYVVRMQSGNITRTEKVQVK